MERLFSSVPGGAVRAVRDDVLLWSGRPGSLLTLVYPTMPRSGNAR